MSHPASSAACCHQRQNLVPWHNSRQGIPAARLEEGQGVMGVGSACEGGPCTGHLQLKTKLYQARGVPRRVIRSVWGLWKTHPCP